MVYADSTGGVAGTTPITANSEGDLGEVKRVRYGSVTKYTANTSAVTVAFSTSDQAFVELHTAITHISMTIDADSTVLACVTLIMTNKTAITNISFADSNTVKFADGMSAVETAEGALNIFTAHYYDGMYYASISKDVKG